MLEPIEVHVGGQTRELRVSPASLIQFKSLMPGGVGLREALVLHLDPGVVALALVVMLRHKGKGGDMKVTPYRTSIWVGELGKQYPELEAKVILAAERFFRESGLLEDEPAGEAKTAPSPSGAPSSTSGTTSSASQAASTSTPGSSSSSSEPAS
jgi:hypothetical protein